jgi:chromosome segregation ATPase
MGRMTNPPALEQRVTKLEYYVFEQLPPKMAAMNLAATQIYALTEANGEAIAGLRVDMAALQTGVHADMCALKAALDLQGDSLRKEIGVTRASLLSTMTAFRDTVDRRFEHVDEQMHDVRSDIGTLREDVAFVKDDFAFLKEEVTTLQGDVTTLKDDVGTLKGDVGTLKGDVGTLKDDVGTLKGDVGTLKGDMTALKGEVTEKFAGLDTKLDTLIAEIRSSRAR